MLPLGPISYHLAILPTTEFSIEATGLVLREGIPPGKTISHPWNLLSKFDQMKLLYEPIYALNPLKNTDTILKAFRDPLGALNEFMLRHHDEKLDHRDCLEVKYPV